MQISDVIADMLTRIRNAGTAKHERVDIPGSNLKRDIADILLEEGYIENVEWIDPIERLFAKNCDRKEEKHTYYML